MIIAMNKRILITTVGNFDLSVAAALNNGAVDLLRLCFFVFFITCFSGYGNHKSVVHRLFYILVHGVTQADGLSIWSCS